MKVYVVYTGYSSYFDIETEGIFSSRDKAEEYLNSLEDPGFVEEYEVDNPKHIDQS